MIYDGEFIANTTSTVVVTVNYRLGAIGFLVYGDDDSGPRGNYGLKVSQTFTVGVRDFMTENWLCSFPFPGPATGTGMDPGQHR